MKHQRAAITAATRRPEPECVTTLLDAATLPPAEAARARNLAHALVTALRAKKRGRGVDGLVQEYALSSQEGVALMCLAEALLRIPDAPTRDALIRDKLAHGDWRAHVGHSPSLFVNAATWGLVVTGRLVASVNETSLASALTRLLARGGEPVIRRGVDMAMRMMGEQFVTGQTIDDALVRSRPMQARGFRYSYDMLGEAATTAEDARRYLADYETAIRAIGQAAHGAGVLDGPGISIKLSALHPRYVSAKRERVMAELLPRLQGLAHLARAQDIGLNIDAEEADRLELSLDLLDALCRDPVLEGWHGIGFVVQAYQKRAPFVLDWLITLGRETGHRLMVRLVKGAYWDSEIKRAQVDGLADFPVFTRKIHTDVSYLACAARVLAAPDAVFPQFATHNAQTLAAIVTMAPGEFRPGQYEFQCLHGMGEPLYEEVVGPGKLGRPCRIYAPVGTHETLLAYLVRRLLENGANSSFVNRVSDPAITISTLIADPAAEVSATPSPGAPHPGIALPPDLFAPRRNSAGLDLASDTVLADVATWLRESAELDWRAGDPGGTPRPVLNPADHADRVGWVVETHPFAVPEAIGRADAAGPAWAETPVAERSRRLRAAADAFEQRRPMLLGLLAREAGKTLPNAVGEIREAVDFLRYYASEAERTLAGGAPLGPVACISPWNFPLAIFTGQIAAALAAGNTVLAKPAEETPLVAAEAIRLLHEAGIPWDAVQLLPGDGAVGAALVADSRVQGVVFTGSTAVARSIQRVLAERLTRTGTPVPLIAETGGQNAMVVDSSALAEQVVGDAIASAFDSAGQRCSALRILCLQDDIADRALAMLKGAMRELEIGRPDRLSVDIGPVISAEALAALQSHVSEMAALGHTVHSTRLPDAAGAGSFMPPTLIEIAAISDVPREVFGPVLHVLRFARDRLDDLLHAIDGSGYGLTFGLHTRIDETAARVLSRVGAGNVYINRDTIGAVVGSQPFGGNGLSGTGPKAGGPLYLRRLTATAPIPPPHGDAPAACASFATWLEDNGEPEAAARCRAYAARSPVGTTLELPGPTGERNSYEVRPRGKFAALARSPGQSLDQIAALLATGNRIVLPDASAAAALLDRLPAEIRARIETSPDWLGLPDIQGALVSGDPATLMRINQRIANRPGPILLLLAGSEEPGTFRLESLVEERSISTNTAAAGGNATLMTLD